MGTLVEQIRFCLGRGTASAASMAFVGLLGAAAPASGFALYRPVYQGGDVDVEASIQQAPRWAAELVDGTGLHDQIRVGVAPSFALRLGAASDQVAQVQGAVAAAFDAWSNDALGFDVSFGADLTAGDYEITLQTYEGGTGFGEPFGFASITEQWVPDRLLTNGQRYDGWVITHGSIQINATNLRWFRTEFDLILTEQGLLDALQKLIMHESGHALGFDHPTVAPVNFDTDGDPYNAMVIDPVAPWSGLSVASSADEDAIMSGLAYGASFASLFNVELHGDDAAARDALYSVAVPEPPLVLLVAVLLGFRPAMSRRRELDDR
jgi:hypothetical protein